MVKGNVQVYYGEGRGKSTAAIGNAIQAASEGENVFIIQFLKGKNMENLSILQRLEPEIKIFRFEKSEACYDQLSEEDKAEAGMNMKNGLNFAKKVLVTGECSVLILDEVLGLLDHGIISEEDLKNIVQAKDDETTLIFTGRVLDASVKEYAHEIYHIVAEKC